MKRNDAEPDPTVNGVAVNRLESVAIKACQAGGDRLSQLFGTDTTAEFLTHDVKSDADRASETAMLSVICDEFPNHEVYAEESGRHGDNSQFEWIVDPLDGTNNFEAGLPTFTTAVTVLSNDRPVVGVVYAPLVDDCYVGIAGRGVRYNGQKIPLTDSDRQLTPSASTVVSVIGHDVKRDKNRLETVTSIDRLVESRCKRRLESWCPTLHWALLSRGRLDGIYCYHPDCEEQRLGELFAAETGRFTASRADVYVAAMTAELKEYLLSCLSEGDA